MKIVTFTDANDEICEIQVTDEVYDACEAMDEQEALDERRETRRHFSLEKAMENGWDIADPRVDVVATVDKRLRYQKLHKALDMLSDRQRELIDLVFFKGLSQVEVAAQRGTTKKAINNRLVRILRKLKKILK